MKNLILALILSIGILSSCESEKSKLVNNKTFTQDETKELLNLIRKFDKVICEIEAKELTNDKECYRSFRERIRREIREGDYNIGITEQKQDEILRELSVELKNEIWSPGNGIKNRRYPINSNNIYPDTVKSIWLNQKKYYRFLKNDVAKVNSNTAKYFDRLEAVGAISPTMFADIAENYTNYDLEDERIKLLYVIHWLTINQNNLFSDDSYDRLMKELKNNNRNALTE